MVQLGAHQASLLALTRRIVCVGPEPRQSILPTILAVEGQLLVVADGGPVHDFVDKRVQDQIVLRERCTDVAVFAHPGELGA